MASSLLYPATMGTPTDGPPAGESSTSDLGAFNRWLCLTRLRAAAAVAAFATVIAPLGLATINLVAVFAVCGGLALTSLVGLAVRPLRRVPVPFFYAQTAVDLLAITLGIGCSTSGQPAVLFHLIYALVIVPASLFSSPAGVTAAIVATIGHELLVGVEHGFAPGAFVGVESLVPVFLFFLIAHQTAFYGSHLHEKNRILTGLAERLEESRQNLAAEGRLSAALGDAAQTLSASVEAPALFEHLTRTTREQLCADLGATFLVDLERNTFHMAAATDSQLSSGELSRIEFPLSSWSAVGRLTVHRVVVLNGRLAECTPAVFTGDRKLATVLLAALYNHGAMVGFLAVGYTELLVESSEWALRLLAGIAEHATIVMHNATLLEEVKQASALKTEFVGAISHELRSPLNVILGYLEMALDGGLGTIGSELEDALRRARRQSIELLELITALLDLNRLEAGRLPVHRASVSMARLGRRRRGPRSAHRAALRSGPRRRGPGLEPGGRRDALHGHAAVRRADSALRPGPGRRAARRRAERGVAGLAKTPAALQNSGDAAARSPRFRPRLRPAHLRGDGRRHRRRPGRARGHHPPRGHPGADGRDDDAVPPPLGGRARGHRAGYARALRARARRSRPHGHEPRRARRRRERAARHPRPHAAPRRRGRDDRHAAPRGRRGTRRRRAGLGDGRLAPAGRARRHDRRRDARPAGGTPRHAARAARRRARRDRPRARRDHGGGARARRRSRRDARIALRPAPRHAYDGSGRHRVHGMHTGRTASGGRRAHPPMHAPLSQDRHLHRRRARRLARPGRRPRHGGERLADAGGGLRRGLRAATREGRARDGGAPPRSRERHGAEPGRRRGRGGRREPGPGQRDRRRRPAPRAARSSRRGARPRLVALAAAAPDHRLLRRRRAPRRHRRRTGAPPPPRRARGRGGGLLGRRPAGRRRERRGAGGDLRPRLGGAAPHARRP